MAFVYPFPENITQYSFNGLEKLFEYIGDNISYYKINVQDYRGEIYNIPITNKEELKEFQNNINEYNYILLSYNLYPRSIYPIEKEIRGIIFKNMGDGNFECIARPLHKFYNVGEEIYIKSYIDGIEGVPDDDNEISFYFNGQDKPNVELKEDGAMIQIFLDNNSELPNVIDVGNNRQIVFNTKNTLAKNIFVDDFLSNFEDVNEIISGMYSLLIDLNNKYDETATLIFEYVNPELETHVVQYNEKQLYLIDIRLNESGKYLTYEEKLNIYNNYFNNTQNLSLVSKQNINDENELLEKREEKYIEGYVLKKFEMDGEFFHYTKFKTKWYLDRGFYDGLDIVNFSLKDLLILYTLGEEDTFFQKIDNPKNTELLRRLGTDPREYKNFVNEVTGIFQDKLVKNILNLRQELYNFNFNINNKYIDKRFLYNLTDNDLVVKLYKRIVGYILDKNNIKQLTKDEITELFMDNNRFVDIMLNLMYLSVFNFDNSKGKLKKKRIYNLIDIVIDSDSFTEWSNKILNKDANGDLIIYSDKQELVAFMVYLLEKLYKALKKVYKQTKKKNFIFIFYNLVYEDIFEELEKEGIDKNTFNLILNYSGNIIGFNPDYNIPLILGEIYKYKNKIDPASELINKIINNNLNKTEKELYFEISKDPKVVNLLRLYKFDKTSYERLKNVNDSYYIDFILNALFYN